MRRYKYRAQIVAKICDVLTAAAFRCSWQNYQHKNTQQKPRKTRTVGRPVRRAEMQTDLDEARYGILERCIEGLVIVSQRVALVVTDQINNGREAKGLHEAVQAVTMEDFYQLVTASLPATQVNQCHNTHSPQHPLILGMPTQFFYSIQTHGYYYHLIELIETRKILFIS